MALDYLTRAEEHRGWVELWVDLDPREAIRELGYFAHELHRAEETLTADHCRAGDDDDVLVARISHEWRWHARTSKILSDTLGVASPGR